MLLAINTAGSMSRAASPLGVSQTALSRLVRETEQSYGIRLFDRTGRGVRPSKAGEVFFAHAQSVVDEFDKLVACTQRMRDQDIDELNVSIPLRVGRLIMAPIVTEFYRSFPNASIHVFENLNLRTQELVADGTMHIGLFYTPPKPSNLSCETIGTEDLYAFGSADVLHGQSETITMAEVASFPLLIQSKPAHYRNLIESRMLKAGFKPKIGRELETIASHAMFAMEGEGLTILPYSNLCQEVENGELVARKIVEPKISRRISIAACSNSASPVVRQTVALIKQAFDANRDRARWIQAA